MSFQPSRPDIFPSVGQGDGSLRRREFIQVAGYEIEGEIGRGGMATVYRATQQSLGRRVAIKVLARELDDSDEFAKRFKKEGRILARLLHPNIVTIHDIGISDDHRLFLSVEYLSGGTLRDRLRLGLSFDSAIHIIRCIAKALGYAHDRGVVHRDVKPSNIMFRHDDTPVLTDFGVARVAGSNTVHTMTGLMVGSPGYMSPEQAMGESTTIQSDLYGLGVVFYEMLAGHPPYQADNPLTVMLKHVHDPIPKLPGGHADLQPIMDKLLAKKAADRYRNADEFLSALNSLIPGDTGSQPAVATSATYPRVVEVTTRTLRRLLSGRSRISIWGGVIGGSLLLIVVVVTLKLRSAAERIELASEASQPIALSMPVARDAKIAELLQQAEAHLKAGHLTDEAEQNAEAAYRQVLKLDRGNAQALTGLENIAREYERLAQQYLEAGVLQDSLVPIQKGLAVTPSREGLLRLRREAEQRMAERNAQAAEQERQRQLQVQAEEYLAQAQNSFKERHWEISQAYIEQGLLAMPSHAGLLALREQVKKAQLAEQQRQAEIRRKQEEVERQKAEQARQQAAEAERQKAEQARQEAELAKRRQEAEQYWVRAVEYQKSGQYAEGLQQIDKGLALVPEHPELLRLRETVRSQQAAEQQRQAELVKREQEIKALLKQADVHIQAKRLTEPVGNNAEASYRQVLKLEADNTQAQAGLERIAQNYLQQARQWQAGGALQESLSLIDKGLVVVPDQPELLRLREEVGRGITEAKAQQERAEEQQRRAERFLTQAQSDLQKGNLEASLAQIEQGLQVVSNHRELLALREQVKVQLAEQQRQAEIRKKQEEVERQKAKQARQQAEELERQKAEQARQEAEMAKRRQEVEKYWVRAVEYQKSGQYVEGLQQIDQGLALVPEHPELLRLQKTMRAQLATEQQRQAEQAKREKEIAALLERAESQFKANRLTEPKGNNAEASYRQVIKLDAGNVQAQAGLKRIAQSYLQQAKQQQSANTANKLQDSLKLIEKGLTVIPDQLDLLHLREEIRSQQATVQQKSEQQRLERKQKEQQKVEQQRQNQQRQEEIKRLEQQRKEQKRVEQQRQEGQQLKLEQRQGQRQKDEKQRREEKQRQEQQRNLEQQQQEQQRKLEQQRQEEWQRQEQQRKLKQQQREQQPAQSLPELRSQPSSEPTKPRVFGTF